MQTIINTLKDASRYPEWNIGVHKVKYVSMAAEPDKDTKNKSKNHSHSQVFHDVISLETDFTSSPVIKIINKVSQKFQGDSLIRKIVLVNR